MFKEGDKVWWKSQANGRHIKKQGVGVEVVDIAKQPSRVRFPSLYKHNGVGGSREHVSYVVKVGNKYYWPRMKDLRAGEA
jgi:hypothetical protein